jgi:hypothetical protein
MKVGLRLSILLR